MIDMEGNKLQVVVVNKKILRMIDTGAAFVHLYIYIYI